MPGYDDEDIVEILRFSLAEARLAKHLAFGLPLEQAAKALDVSINTVRTQLGSMFRKTDTRWQTDLVRFITGALGKAVL